MVKRRSRHSNRKGGNPHPAASKQDDVNGRSATKADVQTQLSGAKFIHTAGEEPRNLGTQQADVAGAKNETMIASWTRAVAIFTGLLFLATVGLGIISILQWKALKRSDEATHSLATSALAQTGTLKEQLSAFQDANRINSLAFTSVQRAFVTPLPIEAALSVASGGERSWTFITSVENSGNTPTKNMEFYQTVPCLAQMVIKDAPDVYCNFYTKGGRIVSGPTDPAEALTSGRMKVGKFPLGPHARVVIGDVTAREADLSHSWFLEGIVTYSDIFPGTARHQTKYCYTIIMWPPSGPESKPLFKPCEKWNCVDDECS